jgi:hypothetical protein
MGANPHASGGLLLQDLRLRFRNYAVEVPKRFGYRRVDAPVGQDAGREGQRGRQQLPRPGPDETASAGSTRFW